MPTVGLARRQHRAILPIVNGRELTAVNWWTGLTSASDGWWGPVLRPEALRAEKPHSNRARAVQERGGTALIYLKAPAAPFSEVEAQGWLAGT